MPLPASRCRPQRQANAAPIPNPLQRSKLGVSHWKRCRSHCPFPRPVHILERKANDRLF